MVRPHGIKGQKRKKREEKYDEEEEEVEETVETTTKKAKGTEEERETEEDGEVQINEMEGIPIVPSDKMTRKPGVIFVLERASLEVAKVGKVLTL